MHIEYRMPYDKINFFDNKYNTIVNGLWVSITFLAIAGGIRLSKKWYLRQRENEALAKQKIRKEIQMVKTQLHPRFLFHSLTIVQKYIRQSSPLAPELILQLSDLLSYTLYENDKEWVLLEKELEIIQNYIELEKKSAEGKLTGYIDITGNISGRYISPLILLFVVEKCFECFLIDNHTHTSFALTTSVKDNQLNYQLQCGTFSDTPIEIDAVNVKFLPIQKQLENLYSGKHQLRIETDKEGIIIDLQLQLKNDDPVNANELLIQKELHEHK